MAKLERVGVIPARYASSRFPGKPLADILGKPMFWHAHHRASQAARLEKVVVATDHPDILRAARALDVPCLMTSEDCQSGSDRVIEAARALGLAPSAIVVNIQGDEPALDPGMIDELLQAFDDPEVRVATLARPLEPAEALSPDRVKVALNLRSDALYFSRAPIPGQGHGVEPGGFLLHLGLYAYRLEALELFGGWEPSPLERREKLEQLRFLENGVPIRVVTTQGQCHGVDRPEDIALVTDILSKE